MAELPFVLVEAHLAKLTFRKAPDDVDFDELLAMMKAIGAGPTGLQKIGVGHNADCCVWLDAENIDNGRLWHGGEKTIRPWKNPRGRPPKVVAPYPVRGKPSKKGGEGSAPRVLPHREARPGGRGRVQ